MSVFLESGPIVVRDAACVGGWRGVHFRSRFCQGSSEVEQGTHKPLVASSSLAPGTTRGGTDRKAYGGFLEWVGSGVGCLEGRMTLASGDCIAEDVAVDVGEAAVDTVVTNGKFRVIDS